MTARSRAIAIVALAVLIGAAIAVGWWFPVLVAAATASIVSTTRPRAWRR